MVRRLGGQRWRRLHRLAYVVASGGVLHFLWLVKADLREPLIYLGILLLLFLARVPAVAEWLSKIRTRSVPLKNDARSHRSAVNSTT
jgi:sulfoxide reductase heme-binding subunit YedZ